MAHLVRAGHDVAVFDLNKAALDASQALGARVVASPVDAARDVEAVFLSLPTPAIVSGVVDDILGVAGKGPGRRRPQHHRSRDNPAPCYRGPIEAMTISTGSMSPPVAHAYASAALGRTVTVPLPTNGPLRRSGVVGLRDLDGDDTVPAGSPVRRRGLFGLTPAGA